jgi:TonB family protein
MSKGILALEMVTRWRGNLLDHRLIKVGEVVRLGPQADCELRSPTSFGEQTVAVAAMLEDGYRLCAPQVGTLKMGEQSRALGAYESHALDHQVATELDCGDFCFAFRTVPTPSRLPIIGGWPSLKDLGGHLASLSLHFIFLIIVMAVPPAGAALTLDHFDTNTRLAKLIVQPEVKQDQQVPKWLQRQEREKEKGSAGGKPAPGKKGKMGDRKAPKVNRRVAVKGNSKRLDPRGLVQKTGVLSILNGKENATVAALLDPTRTALGGDALSALGNLDGKVAGPAYGSNGLDVLGLGRGGGCPPGAECGNTVGGDPNAKLALWRGKGKDDKWNSKPGNNPGHRAKAPPRDPQPKVSKGCLSRSIVRRRIRRQLPQIKYCYSRELQANKGLSGRVSVDFAILPNGSVGMVSIKKSTLDSDSVEGCIKQAVRRMSFPKPECPHLVKVSYPFIFRRAGD